MKIAIDKKTPNFKLYYIRDIDGDTGEWLENGVPVSENRMTWKHFTNYWKDSFIYKNSFDEYYAATKEG